MAKRLLMIRREFFDLIANGHKTLEVRSNDSRTKHIEAQDTLILLCGYDMAKATVMAVRFYGSFLDMLGQEDIDKIWPGSDTNGIIDLFCLLFPNLEHHGIIVIELSVLEITQVKKKIKIQNPTLF